MEKSNFAQATAKLHVFSVSLSRSFIAVVIGQHMFRIQVYGITNIPPI